jgi:hypothetical protein
MPRRPIVETSGGATVEYRLLRDVQLAKLKAGRILQEDLCDAQYELLRVAKNLGRPMGEQCPVCDTTELVQVVFVFGNKLPASGFCPTSRAELLKLERREEPVQCYAVEVCVTCKFNYLLRKWSSGDRAVRRNRTARS